MAPKTITALQYSIVMQQLPNPLLYWEKGEARIRVSVLREPLDPACMTVFDESSTSKLNATSLVAADIIEFEVVPNNTSWHWQPVNPLVITPVQLSPFRSERKR